MTERTRTPANPASSPPSALRRWLGEPNSALQLALLAYVALVVLLMPNYLSFYYKDEIAYVAAAERYARGDFAAAPNSLWGPLISWLMAAAMSVGASSLAAARAVPVLIGAATLWSVNRLSKTLDLQSGLRWLYLLTLVPYVLYFSLLGATDDLPLTALLILYFSIIFDPRYPDRRFAGALCGVLGGLAYYAKGFALGFFLVHFSVSTALHWFAQREGQARKRVIRKFAAGMAVFAALAAIWVAALYQKYGVVTFGITGQYNYQIVGPEAKERPALYVGFVEPPKTTTVSIWEDPAYFYDLPAARQCCLKPWSPFDSGSAFKHQLLLFKLNFGRTLMTFLSYSPLTLLVAFAALAFCLAPLWPSKRKGPDAPTRGFRAGLENASAAARLILADPQRFAPTLMLFTIVLYPIPYTLVFSDERFFWPVLILFMGLGFYLLTVFFREQAVSRNARLLVAGLFSLSFLAFPAYTLATGNKARNETALIAKQLNDPAFAGSSMASNTDYGASMVVAYYLKAKYYGSAAPGMSEEAITEDLKRKGIRYYLVWGIPPSERAGMRLSKVVKGSFRPLSVYEVQTSTGSK